MTGAEWLASEEPETILLLLWDSGRGTDRQIVLFVVAYVMRTSTPEERLDFSMEPFEQFAEGLITAEQIAATHGRAWKRNMHELLEDLLGRREGMGWVVDEQMLTSLFFCVFGDPRRPLPLPAPELLRWHDATIPRIAEGIYDERAFDPLPILADALFDAGCDDEAILSHCREPGPHVRGCWVIDLLLGKE
jgi:hypothetical protein